MCSPHLNAGGEPSFRFTPSHLLLLSLTAELLQNSCLHPLPLLPLLPPTPRPQHSDFHPLPRSSAGSPGGPGSRLCWALLLEWTSHPSSTKAKALATQTHSVPRGQVLSASQATHDALLFALSGTFFLSTLSLPIPPSLPGLGFPFMAPDSWLGQRPPPAPGAHHYRVGGVGAGRRPWFGPLCYAVPLGHVHRQPISGPGTRKL